MSVLTQFRWNSSRPIISRAALRGIGGSINFSLTSLVIQHLRRLQFGQVIEESDAHYGHTVDQRNEIDIAVESEGFEAQLREDQGFTVALPPLELAARLKVIRDACAAELEPHATLRRNPLTKKPFKYPFDLVPPISENIAWTLKQPAKISEAVVKNTMKVLRIDEQSIRLMLEKDHQTQQKFLKDNLNEIFSIIDTLEAKGGDGHAMGIDDDETIEEGLPALNRARLYVAADSGLVQRRVVDVKAYTRGNPDALGNIGMIDGERKLLRMKYFDFMKDPAIKDEIAEAVSRGAKPPVLQALFPDIDASASSDVAVNM